MRAKQLSLFGSFMDTEELARFLDKPVYEDDGVRAEPDPDEVPIQERRLITQPYDLAISSLIDQIEKGTLYLRPISDRPRFQRRYVWSNRLASRFVESILLNVPIPPCYLSQNSDYEYDVIDGQQRIYSIYRYVRNQFELSSLEVLKEYNGHRFHQLPSNLQRKLTTYTLRCVVITNDSHPEIRFDVFERLNTNTVPLNAQELRNCIYRGSLIDLLNELAEYKPWLEILGRSDPDRRMRGEELILRFYAFQLRGVDSYRTPQKHWLNDAAELGQQLSRSRVSELEILWKETLQKSLIIFEPNQCFRRLPLEKPRMVINRALMDLTMHSIAKLPARVVPSIAEKYKLRYERVLQLPEFDDLITRAIDHKSRTLRRFQLWQDEVLKDLS